MSKALQLRDYQLAAVDELRDGIRRGFRSLLLQSPVGSGKTVMAVHLLNECKGKGRKAAFVVDRVALVDQASATLDSYGIDHGVIQAGHWRNRGYELIQVCSAQTLEKRGIPSDLALMIVDEAHCVRKETANFIKHAEHVKVVGLTATPFAKGLGELYSELVNVATTNELIEGGHLVPLKMYAAKALDMTGAKVIAGEWADRDVEERGLKIVGDIVSEWVSKTHEHFGGPVKTIVFSATVAHGEELCRQFNAAGFNFQQISYKDANNERRRELIEEFRKPDSAIQGLVSVEVLTKGFDVPDVLCGVAARPYRKSLSSHIQQLGRVMRPFGGKTFGLWLDHCGNAMRFYDDVERVFSQGVESLSSADLDSRVRKDPEEKVVEHLRCGKCKYVLSAGMRICPACGHERTTRSMVETVAGEMVLINGKPMDPKYAFLRNQEKIFQQLAYIALQKKKGNAEDAQRFAKGIWKGIYGVWPRRKVTDVEPMPATPEFAGLVQHNIIKFAKSKGRSHALR